MTAQEARELAQKNEKERFNELIGIIKVMAKAGYFAAASPVQPVDDQVKDDLIALGYNVEITQHNIIIRW